MTKFEGRWAGEALSLLRIVAALLFLLHGSIKLFGFPPFPMELPPTGIAAVDRRHARIDRRPAAARPVSCRRPVAFLLSGEMAVAYWMFHAPQSTFPIG